MDRSSFLARLIGPTFVAIALGMLINLSIYEKMIAEVLRHLSGLLSLLAGLAIINLHNNWHMDWRVIITMLGWVRSESFRHQIIKKHIQLTAREHCFGSFLGKPKQWFAVSVFEANLRHLRLGTEGSLPPNSSSKARRLSSYVCS